MSKDEMKMMAEMLARLTTGQEEILRALAGINDRLDGLENSVSPIPKMNRVLVALARADLSHTECIALGIVDARDPRGHIPPPIVPTQPSQALEA